MNLELNNYEETEEVNEGSYADDDLDENSIIGAENNILNIGDTVECLGNYPTMSPTNEYSIMDIDKRSDKVSLKDDLGFVVWINAEHLKLV